MPSHLHVCQSGSCWSRGAHSTLVELEELASVVGGVTVEKMSCFGRCKRGPNAAITWHDGSEVILSGLKTVKDNIGAIKRATGRTVDTDERLLARLHAMRKVSEFEMTLTDVQVELEVLECSPSKLASRSSLAKLDKLLELVDDVIARCSEAHPHVLAHTVRRKVAALREGRPVSPSTADALDEDPEYKVACWRVEAIEPSSQHSVIFHLSSQDTARGRVVNNEGPRIWHVALHVEREGQRGVGDEEDGGDKEDDERVVLREYTPISSDAAWESPDRSESKLSLLVRIYPDGRASQWLHGRAVGDAVWLSPPRTTLLLPTLTPEAGASTGVDFSSVVLLAGGTGIAPLWQIMCNAMCNDVRLATLPLTLVYSCRGNDILLAQPISECITGRPGSKAIFAVTEDASGPPAYAHVATAGLGELREQFTALRFVAGRVSQSLLREVLVEHPTPRVVVSGPEGFMEHVGTVLRQEGVSRRAIVCLKA